MIDFSALHGQIPWQNFYLFHPNACCPFRKNETVTYILTKSVVHLSQTEMNLKTDTTCFWENIVLSGSYFSTFYLGWIWFIDSFSLIFCRRHLFLLLNFVPPLPSPGNENILTLKNYSCTCQRCRSKFCLPNATIIVNKFSVIFVHRSWGWKFMFFVVLILTCHGIGSGLFPEKNSQTLQMNENVAISFPSRNWWQTNNNFVHGPQKHCCAIAAQKCHHW